MFKDLNHADKKYKNKYGFVEIRNPEYMCEFYDERFGETYVDEMKYLMRKPSPAERREIVINLIMQNSGRRFKIGRLAELLAVSQRTVQSLLKSLREDGLIEAVSVYGKNGAQLSSRYRYIGPPCKVYGSGLTLESLYDSENAAGFRHWAWKDFAFRHDGRWHNVMCQVFSKFRANEARRKYLQDKGIKGVVPNGIKYIVLRYSYWKGEAYKICSYDVDNDCEFFRATRDGTYKFELKTERQYDIVRINGHRLLLFYMGNASDPKVRIYDLKEGKKQATFSWFGENLIAFERRLEGDMAEEFMLCGDFTTR